MRILIVEDSPTDRKLLRYLLEGFQAKSEIVEAHDLKTAQEILGRDDLDLVILDLQLPDSSGKSTFESLNSKFPTVPIIVMTHNKDRDLALDMIRAGAADYLLKEYTNEEDVGRRITFAIEKHRQSVRIPSDQVPPFQRLDKARSGLARAKGSKLMMSGGQMAEATDAIAEVTQHTYGELRRLTEFVTAQGAQQAYLIQTVGHLERELLHGQHGRPSMRSQVDLLDHRAGALERKVQGIVEDAEKAEETQRTQALQLQTAKLSNRAKVIVAVLGLLGVVATSVVTYIVARHQAAQEQTK